MVETTGVFSSLRRDRKEKSRPLCAMEKIMRGRGNMKPSKLRHRTDGMSKEGREWGGLEIQTEACAKMSGLFLAVGSVANIN